MSIFKSKTTMRITDSDKNMTGMPIMKKMTARERSPEETGDEETA